MPHTDPRTGQKQTLRNRLLLNLSVAAIILSFGLSHATAKMFFDTLHLIVGVSSKTLSTTLYATIFIVLPVFLLGQTVPLVSNYFRREHLSTFAGRILFSPLLAPSPGRFSVLWC